MSPLGNKTVFITGASAGIGEATATAMAEAGARLILTARRKDRLEKLAARLKQDHGAESLIQTLDVRRQKDVSSFIDGLPDDWRAIDILVNNAGLGRGLDKLHEGSPEDWDEMIDTNVKGLLYVSRAIVPGMVRRGSGHVINVGSIAGHEVYPGGNVYCATKYAVDAITKSLRVDLVDTPVRVSTVDPGLVQTDFSKVRFRGDETRAKKPYENITPLTGRDIAEVIVFIATRPAHVTIAEAIVFPVHQASASVVFRKPN